MSSQDVVGEDPRLNHNVFARGPSLLSSEAELMILDVVQDYSDYEAAAVGLN